MVKVGSSRGKGVHKSAATVLGTARPRAAAVGDGEIRAVGPPPSTSCPAGLIRPPAPVNQVTPATSANAMTMAGSSNFALRFPVDPVCLARMSGGNGPGWSARKTLHCVCAKA